MKNYLIGGLGGFVLGIALTFYLVFAMSADLMLLEDESQYNFEQTEAKLRESIKAQGWVVPTVHDLQKSMAKFGHEIKPVKVFEVCEPNIANKVLSASDDRIVSSLMPCRISIYEKNDGKTYISRMNSGLMAQVMSPLIIEVMSEASAQNEVILEAILKK